MSFEPPDWILIYKIEDNLLVLTLTRTGTHGDLLIPPDKYTDFLSGPISRESILSFSKSIRVHPGIVVGRLQHENRLQYNQLNDLKITWK